MVLLAMIALGDVRAHLADPFPFALLGRTSDDDEIIIHDSGHQLMLDAIRMQTAGLSWLFVLAFLHILSRVSVQNC